MQDDLPKVGHSLFSTDMVPKSQRFEIWHDSISVLFDVAPIEDQPDPSFSAEVESFMVGSMMLARTRSKVQHFSRSNRTIARDGMEHIMLQQYTRGGNDIMTSDKVVRTHAGDIQIIDMGQPTETRTHAENHSAARAVGDEFSNLTVIVARNRLEDMIPNLAALHLQVVRSGTPLNMILSSYIHSLFLQARTLNQVEAEKLTAPTVELIAAAFSDRSDTREVCQTAVDDAVLLSVRRFIDANLHDPDMNPAVIAAALGISRASLFRICEPLGGVMAFVRDRRLHLARRQLLATPTKPLKLLAFEIGFSSPSAFARAFKEQFGFSPSEARDIRTTARDRSVPKHGFAIDRTYEYWMSNLVR